MQHLNKRLLGLVAQIYSQGKKQMGESLKGSWIVRLAELLDSGFM